MEAIILAGGLGTRLRPVVPDVPKPIAPVRGVPFLLFVIDHWIEQGITRFVISVGYRHEAIHAAIGLSRRGVEIEYAIEREPLGTGGALATAAGSLVSRGADVLALNGDTFFDIPLAALVRRHSERKAMLTIAARRPEGDVGRGYGGIEAAADGRVRAFSGVTASAAGRLVNGGVYCLSPALLEKLDATRGPCSLEAELFPEWVREGNGIYAFETQGVFIDIGTPADYARAGDLLAGKLRRAS